MLSLLKVWALFSLIQIIRIFDVISNRLFGWTFSHGSQQERQLAKSNFAHSAQVVSVVAKTSNQPGYYISNVNCHYLLRHVKYMDPRVILEDDSICLSHMTLDSAIFAVPRKGEDFFDTKKSPFLNSAIYNLADTYIKVPISTLHQLADEAGDPTALMCMTASTLRCGSTLIMQILNRVPNTRTLSESNVFSSITQAYYWHGISEDEVRKRLRSAIHILAKTRNDSRVERVTFKVAETLVPWLGIVKELFPRIKMIKNTRHPINSVLSLRKVGTVMFEGLLGKWGSNWRNWSGPAFILALERCSGISRPAKLNPWWWWGLITMDDISILYYVSNLTGVQKVNHVFDMVVLFEDLIGDREVSVRKILKIIDMDNEETVKMALEAYEKDSQNGIFDRKTSADLSNKMRESANYWMNVANLPINVDCPMETFREYVKA